MGKITDALKKAAKEQIQRIEKKPSVSYRFIAKKTADSKIDPHIVAFYDKSSSVSEQYRILRTNIFSLNANKPPKVLAISSSIMNEGKTVTSINLAISIAQDLNKKSVLLIDADLRKGKMKRYLGIESDRGLSDILNDGHSLDDSLLDIGIKNLTVLPAGSKSPHPAELLGSWKMKNLIDMLRQRFDYIIIDTPPVVSLTDAGIIGAQTDGVVMVVQASRTQKSVVKHARELLLQAQAKVIGFVLTNVQYHLPEYLYRYVQSGKY